MKRLNEQKGFTLIEVLIVIGIIAVLAAVVLVAINPARHFAQAHNAQRATNVEALLNAIGQRSIDNKGVFAGTFTAQSVTYTCPTLVAGTTYDIASSGGGTIDLSCLTPTYISVQLPTDPTVTGAQWASATNYDTKYTVLVDAGGRFTISAPGAELGQIISITR